MSRELQYFRMHVLANTAMEMSAKASFSGRGARGGGGRVMKNPLSSTIIAC